MKKILPVLLALAVLLTFASCASNSDSEMTSLRKTDAIYSSLGLLPEGVSSVEKDVVIPAGDHMVYATITAPAKEGVYPAVVMLHGTGSSRDGINGAYAVTAKLLAENYDIVSIRFDLPGSGDSEADPMMNCYETAIGDSMVVANYLSMLDYVNPNQIGLLGYSEGGNEAMLAASRTKMFSSVVTWAGAPDLMAAGLLTTDMVAFADANGYVMMEFSWREPLRISEEMVDEIMDTDVLAEFGSNYSGPVMAIAGANDEFGLANWANMIVQINGNADSEVLVIPSADHFFNVMNEKDMKTLMTVINDTGEFFQNTLTAN